jgi:hypothetical protein
MPDNLRITTPVANTEGLGKLSPAGDVGRSVPINPERVPRSGTEEEAGRQAADLLLNRSSVFGQFVRQLQQTPGLDRTLQKLLGDAAALSAAEGTAEAQQAVPAPLRALTAAISTNGSGLVERLLAQQKDSTLFAGPLFRLLDQISAQRSDPQFDLRLADFLKAYSGFRNAPGTMQAVLKDLTDLKYSIPVAYAKQLSALMDKLSSKSGADHIDSNLAVLKREIIPMLGEYVAKTNDHGKQRDTISMLLHNTAVLNDSTRENLAAKADQLFDYCRNALGLPDLTISMMRSLLRQEIAPDQDKKQDAFLSELTSLLSQASGGKAPGGLDSSVLNDISHSLLLDSSVFMPFLHLVLPAEIDGRFLFAQAWVEKTDPDEKHRSTTGAGPLPKNVYLTFEIQDLGYFEASVRLNGTQVSMKLSCPSALRSLHGVIHDGISDILKRNGLVPDEIRLSSGRGRPVVPQIVLQKIEERRNSVDVSI